MKLRHPVSKQTIETDESRAAMYESQGWEAPRSAPRSAPRKPAKKAAKKATASKAAK